MRDNMQKKEAATEANPEKDKFISQVLDELGLGKEGKLEEFFCNMAEKIAELCYEVKQLKENGTEVKISPEATISTEPIKDVKINPCCHVDLDKFADRFIKAISERPAGIKLHGLGL